MGEWNLVFRLGGLGERRFSFFEKVIGGEKVEHLCQGCQKIHSGPLNSELFELFEFFPIKFRII